MGEAKQPDYAVADHLALFGAGDGVENCDVCGTPVSDEDEDRPAPAGKACYLWARGDETRCEQPPLCPACAAALGLTALARWEIEEEEG